MAYKKDGLSLVPIKRFYYHIGCICTAVPFGPIPKKKKSVPTTDVATQTWQEVQLQ